jgi:HEAT repeat protein
LVGSRQAAADALAVLGDRAAAGALALKVAIGDDDPLVMTACALALLALAPDWALPRFQSFLAGSNELVRETVALALGQSRLDGARVLLVELLESAPTSAERAVAMRALGLHRTEESLLVLLARIESGPLADAKAAVEALAARGFEPGLTPRVRVAVEASGAESIETLFRELFVDAV